MPLAESSITADTHDTEFPGIEGVREMFFGRRSPPTGLWGRASMRAKPSLGISIFGIIVVLVAVAMIPFSGSQKSNQVASFLESGLTNRAAASELPPERQERVAAPELDGGVAWLNTASPIRMRDLKGKIVLIDFWTFCCINCIHTLPDLAKLEKQYPNQLVVIGVHSAKFENEKNSESIRKAILRYEITHPVVNDADMKIWQKYGVNSWPTLVLIDPEGNVVGKGSGEGLYSAVNERIKELIKIHREKKTLNEEPLHFDRDKFKDRAASPLFFPGKVLADGPGKRLFISDSTHHRVVETDLEGNTLAVAGTGQAGHNDGAFDKASFNDPQGLALNGDILYVADRKNDLIRALDLKNKTVKTIAGTGEQGSDRMSGGPALKTGLNSPWDLYLVGKRLFIAMAGHHQIWTLDLDRHQLEPYAGNGREDIVDGQLPNASFAQPSGLTSDGTNLYVADSEVSAVRSLPLNDKGNVQHDCGRRTVRVWRRRWNGEQGSLAARSGSSLS